MRKAKPWDERDTRKKPIVHGSSTAERVVGYVVDGKVISANAPNAQAKPEATKAKKPE